jgi:hypothetical protein
MIVSGSVISVSHAPQIAQKNKELLSEKINLEWAIQHLKKENEDLREQVNHYRNLILLEGKERKKLSKERTKQKKIQKRKGWIDPESTSRVSGDQPGTDQQV